MTLKDHGSCAGLSFPEYIAVLYLKEKKSGLYEQGRSGKWLMGRQSTMCHSLSLGLSRWLTQGKGSVAGGASGLENRSVELEETEHGGCGM